jgi:putative spermidine/putrescine transport system ATP-binding protein
MSEPPSLASHLALRGLTKRYGETVAVDNLSLEVARGEMLAFLGPSGCGKTTSLRMIAGLVSATTGEILVGGRPLNGVPPHQRDMGLVFQSYALFPHMSVAANVGFGLEMRRCPVSDRARRVAEALRLVHLQGFEKRRPAELSGGQQQRVALARVLVIRPSILLFDEPLSNLDAKLRDEMRSEIRELQQRLGITAIFVTHDQSEALTVCDKVAVLNGGRLEQLGAPEDLYERPATPFVASFIGRGNWFEGKAEQRRVELPWGTVAAARAHSGRVRLMVRPHRIEIAAQAVQHSASTCSDGTVNAVSGTIERVIYSGDLMQYDVTVGQAPATSTIAVERATGGHHEPLAVGTPVVLNFRAADTLVFAAAQ